MKNLIKNIPLYVVELSFDGQFLLNKNDNCFQLHGKDLLWQQYRLVDYGIKNLPDIYDKIVWLDADILFKEEKWDELDHLLNKYKIIQSFNKIEILNSNDNILETKTSATKEYFDHCHEPNYCLDIGKNIATGYSWAIRREAVEKFGIYDRWITGSDDIAFIIGIWGDWENSFFNRLNDNMKKHYFSWSKPFNQYINGSVYYFDTTIQHLWHGHRNYKKRWNCLKDYDPYTDVIEKDGVLEWNSNKPSLHACCKAMCLNYDNEFKLFL